MIVIKKHNYTESRLASNCKDTVEAVAIIKRDIERCQYLGIELAGSARHNNKIIYHTGYSNLEYRLEYNK